MRFTVAIVFISFFFACSMAFGQVVSEIGAGFGVNKTHSSEFGNHYQQNSSPAYFFVESDFSWYRNDRRITIQKEIGLRMQFADIELATGGKASGNSYYGSINSLFAGLALMARVNLGSGLSAALGPAAELLLIGRNRVNYTYFSMFTNPPSYHEGQYKGMNRDYFGNPSMGIKLLLTKQVSEKNTISIRVNYMSTTSDRTNFYVSNSTYVAFIVGFLR